MMFSKLKLTFSFPTDKKENKTKQEMALWLDSSPNRAKKCPSQPLLESLGCNLRVWR